MAHARTAGLETLSDWLRATVETREDALSHCLERISSLDPDIRAWAQVSPRTPTSGGPLLSIPFGAKDIMETRDLQTEFGSDVYRGRIGKADAAIVGELKSRGAVLMGKTHTTAFAYITPAPTRNPRALDHTPGGSSSGSAAAVAAGMVPLALGTQTKGSVLRPASFCGITGFKPTFGLFSLEGILPVAPSLDTLGFFTHTPDDMCALWSALGRAPIDHANVPFGLPDPLPDMDDSMREAIEAAVTRLRRRGTIVEPVKLGDMLPKLAEAAHLVMFYEGARVHQTRYAEHGDSLGDLADLVRAGLAISSSLYNEARQFIGACGTKMADLYRTAPVILAPAATGPAPAGLASTGDPRLNAPWTALGTPAISVPLPVDGLPLGLQLTAARGNDGLVLGAAAQVWTMLRT